MVGSATGSTYRAGRLTTGVSDNEALIVTWLVLCLHNSEL